MPNKEEKKYTVDDILEEYDNTLPDSDKDAASAAAESAAEDSAAMAEKESIYKATELFDSDFTADDNMVETESEVFAAAAEQLAEEETEEIIDDDDTDDLEIVEEIIEEDSSEAENADVSFKEPQTVEEMVLEEAALWDNSPELEFAGYDTGDFVQEVSEPDSDEETESAVEEEITEEPEQEPAGEAEPMEEPESSEQDPVEEETAEQPEDAETALAEENAEEPAAPEEDVNDKFLIRILKSLFPWKGDSVGEIIRKIIFLAATIVFIGAGVMLVSTLVQSEEAVAEKEENQSIITTTVATTIDSEGNVITIAPTEEEIAEHNFNVAEHFKGINEDYIGYLEVDGCEIYEPIMQGDDNDYYLNHNYYGGTNKAGTVFLDFRCQVTEEYISPNIVFYGHNQEDGTMFGNLKHYKQDVEFYRENPLVKFSPEFETGEYVIYGYFVTHVKPEQHSEGEVFHYHDYIETLNDEETFNWYIDEIQERNQIISPVDVQYGDKLLCLSTCSNEFSNSRFVVFARRLREGEKIEDFDFSEARLNPSAKGIDWEAIISCETSLTEETEETTEETIESETVSETTVPEETTRKKRKETTRRSYDDVQRQKKTATTTETETVACDTSETDESSTDTSVSGEEGETSSETTVPIDEEGAETTEIPSVTTAPIQ